MDFRLIMLAGVLFPVWLCLPGCVAVPTQPHIANGPLEDFQEAVEHISRLSLGIIPGTHAPSLLIRRWASGRHHS